MTTKKVNKIIQVKTTREKDTTFIRAITREGLDSGQMPKKYIPTGKLEMNLNH